MTRGEKAASMTVGLLVVLALAAPFVAGADHGGSSWFDTGPSSQDLSRRLAPPGTEGRPLGADALGRDVFARLVYGLRTSLVVAGAGAALAGMLGLALGLAAAADRGFFGRNVGRIASALTDAGAAFPPLFVVVAAAAAMRPGLLGLALLLGVLRASFIARLVRQEARRIAAAPFVLAAEGAGAPALRIAIRHVLPHAATPALVAAAFAVPGNVLAEAALSFLGFGAPEPVASLGSLLRDGRAAIPFAPHLVWIPGLVVAALALACQTLADFARRRLGAPAPKEFA
jgi:peptide/nickel transport system permease protein